MIKPAIYSLFFGELLRHNLLRHRTNYIQYNMIIVSFWDELNSISENETAADELCNCYPTCDRTLYSQEISSAPYPGPLPKRARILKHVFGVEPGESHLCYAK